MTKQQILANATPRPWGDDMESIHVGTRERSVAQIRADDQFILLAVNSYEEREALIGQIVEALEVCSFDFRANRHSSACGIRTTEHCTTPTRCSQVSAALAAAKQREQGVSK